MPFSLLLRLCCFSAIPPTASKSAAPGRVIPPFAARSLSNETRSLTKDADNYGSGFVVDGNQVRGKIAVCNIKSRKEEVGLVHLITSCSTDVALQTVQMSFKIDDDNRITRIFPGAPEMSVSYSRCLR